MRPGVSEEGIREIHSQLSGWVKQGSEKGVSEWRSKRQEASETEEQEGVSEGTMEWMRQRVMQGVSGMGGVEWSGVEAERNVGSEWGTEWVRWSEWAMRQ